MHPKDIVTRLALPLGLLGAGFLGGLSAAQDPEEEPPEFDMAEMMRMQQQAMLDAQPGPEHEEIAKGAGTWDVETKIFMPPMPGMQAMDPMTSEAESVNEMVLGGRFLMSRVSGHFMGMETESISFFGFDRRHDKYVTVGLDTMGTYFVTAEGVRDEDGIIRMHGYDDDGMGGQEYFFELDDSDPDRTVMNIYFSKMGPMEFEQPHKMVEMVQTRRKGEREDG
jgi:hypothetical protein